MILHRTVFPSVMSTIGQIVVDGRIYPSQVSSPASSLPPQGSPSPGHGTGRPPQQPSPMSPLHQLPSPSGFQPSRMPGPPPYSQYQNNNQYQQGINNSTQSMGQNMPQSVGQNINQSSGPNMGQNMQGMGQGISQSMGQNMVQNMGKELK